MADSIFENLEALRLGSDHSGLLNVKEALLHVPVRKPGRHDYVRVQVDPAFSLDCALFEDKNDREFYFVAPPMKEAMIGEIRPVTILTAISRQKVLFLWPVPLPDITGRDSPWHSTQREAAQLARQHWIRMAPDMALGAYRIFQAEGQLSEPTWPDKDLRELLEVAFRGRIIETEDHPIVRRLRGLE